MTMTQNNSASNQKAVTMKDIAAHLGLPYASTRDAYYGKASAMKVAAVRKAAAELGYNPREALLEGEKRGAQTRKNRVKICDVARAVGVSSTTVVNVLGNHRGRHSAETIRKVEEAVSRLGYKTLKALADERAAERSQKFYYNGNFHTKQEEVARMQELRAEGFSNAEIAQKIGRCARMVRNSIGKQPEDMTRMNVAEGQRNRAKRNANRRTYVMTHEINQHNELVEKAERISADIHTVEQQLMTLRREHAEMTEKIASNVPHIRKLSQQVGVPMKELSPVQINLSELAPTVIQ